MSRRYRSPIQVGTDATGAPVRLRWRSRRYEVRAVHARWVEATPWWRALRGTGATSQREVWRVEAVTHSGTSGVFDLVRVADDWRLLRVID